MDCNDCPFGIGPQVKHEGNLDSSIMLIGQSPGDEEVQSGRPFVGPSGALLFDVLGIPRHEVLIDNVMRCQPPKGYEYKYDELKLCSSQHLNHTINSASPKVIICLGNEAWAATTFNPKEMKGVELGVGDIGYRNGIPIVRGLHPSFVLRNPNNFWAFEAAIKRGIAISNGEWQYAEIPDFSSWFESDPIHAIRKLQWLGPTIAVDIESTGFDEYTENLVGISFCDGEHTFYLAFRLNGEVTPLWNADVKREIQHILTEHTLIMHNSKFDSRWLQQFFHVRPNVEFDTLLMLHLINENVPHKLEYAAKWWLNLPDWKHELAANLKEKKQKTYDWADPEIIAQYGCTDAWATYNLWKKMYAETTKFTSYQKPAKPSNLRLYDDIVKPTNDVLLDIETIGIRVDTQAIDEAHIALEKEIERLDDEINKIVINGKELGQHMPQPSFDKLYKRVMEGQEKHPEWNINLIGYTVTIDSDKKSAQNWLATTQKNFYNTGVNPGSVDDLQWLLFDMLGLQSVKTSKKTGDPSTDEEVLDTLKANSPGGIAEQVIDLLLERRRVTKLDGTYVEGLKKWIKEDGRIHCKYGHSKNKGKGKEDLVVTGRLNSRDPNMQNQPKSIRPFYIPADGFVFVEGDYSQMEVRWTAHYSQDPALIQALEQEDVHRAVAAWLFNKPYDEVTEEERNAGKTLNFGILYGMGPDKLAKALNIDKYAAANLISTYFGRFPQVAAWIDEQKSLAKFHGLVYSDFGRLRRLPAAPHLAKMKDEYFLEKCLRQAVNSLPQGSGADTTNLAKVRLTKNIEGYKETWWIVNTVHDSILTEVRKDIVDWFVPEFERILIEKPYEAFSIPLKVDIKVSERWGGDLDINKLIGEKEDGDSSTEYVS